MGISAVIYRWSFRAHSLKSLERNILAFCGIGPMLKLVPCLEFEELVRKTHAQRHARGVACWDQFAAMLARCGSQLPAGRKFRFKHKLVGLDSTVMDLCCQLFDLLGVV